MTIITDNKKLKDLCQTLAACDFFTIDTEFLRDKTYYPQLCLIQVAPPEGEAVAIDPLEANLDLTPLFDLMANENVIKVFHAARQDLEIFYNLMGKVPHPIFDTQVAAMVCGYGGSVGYANLVDSICGEHIDKGAQFTDWSRRPLTSKQLHYALGDVTYLRDVYLHLSNELEQGGRTEWVAQEMDVLTSNDTYENPPQESWRRVKMKSSKPRVLAILREVAAWRENEAQHRDVPRNRVVRDETLVDMAVHAPKSVEDLRHIRNMPGDMARGRLGSELLNAVLKGKDIPEEDCPVSVKKGRFPDDMTPVLEMLKMLLRIQASEHEVAPKLIASTKDLEALALANDENSDDMHAVSGWRYEVFGKDALALKQGDISLGLKNGQIHKWETRKTEK